jgi:hypothetical protein
MAALACLAWTCNLKSFIKGAFDPGQTKVKEYLSMVVDDFHELAYKLESLKKASEKFSNLSIDVSLCFTTGKASAYFGVNLRRLRKGVKILHGSYSLEELEAFLSGLLSSKEVSINHQEPPEEEE